jgi:hypothetical protein
MGSILGSLKTVTALSAGVLSVFLALPALAAEPAVEFVALRIQDSHDRVVIEMPAQLLQFLAEHSKDEKFDVGTIGGRDARLTMADLMKVVQSGKAKDHEVLFFTEKDEHGETGTFYVKTFTRKGHGNLGKPSGLVFTVIKDGKEKVGISVSMDTVASWAKDYGSEEKRKGTDDFGPLVRSALASAQELGVGVLLRIESKDAELIFSLK